VAIGAAIGTSKLGIKSILAFVADISRRTPSRRSRNRANSIIAAVTPVPFVIDVRFTGRAFHHLICLALDYYCFDLCSFITEAKILTQAVPSLPQKKGPAEADPFLFFLRKSNQRT